VTSFRDENRLETGLAHRVEAYGAVG
jgi:hypothetical protein